MGWGWRYDWNTQYAVCKGETDWLPTAFVMLFITCCYVGHYSTYIDIAFIHLLLDLNNADLKTKTKMNRKLCFALLCDLNL